MTIAPVAEQRCNKTLISKEGEKMLANIRWRRLKPDTTNGEMIELTTTYSSFDKAEIDDLQEWFADKYGSGIVLDLQTLGKDGE